MYYYSDMKGSKFDGGKQIPSKGGSLVADTEPLFPRLHVNQTEKTGPRAPPRNKMALYEQFTIPSHRFVPSNQTVATGHQKQFDKYPSYPSYYMPSASPYGSMGHGALAQLHPSYGVGCDSTSSRSAVSYVEDIHRASQKPPLDNHGQNEGTSELKEICKQGSVKSSRSAAYPRSTCTNAVEDTRKDMNDFCVPSLPSHGFGKASIKSLGTQQKPERQISALSSSITGRPVEFSASCDAGLAPSVIENQSSSPGADFPVDNKGPQRNSEGRTVQEVQQVGQQVCTQRSPRLSFHDPEVNGSKNLAKSRAEPQGLNIRTDEVVPLCEDEQESLNSNSQCIQTKTRGASIEDIKVSSQSVEGSEKFVSPRDDSSSEERDAQGGENGDAINTTSPVWVVRKPQNGSTANANLLQHGGDKGLVPGHPVKPKDVIYVVGQQNFWRARKVILRQQRIFSDQVFELHKLIKVQQMLAESPGALIDGDKNLEELAGASSYNATDEEEANLESTRRHTPSSKETFKGQPREIEAHHLGWPQTKQGGAYTSMPTLHPGGVSVWGYPSLGIPCVYPAYVPGSGFCTQLMGPMPQFTSFGLPLDQKKEVSGDGQSSYGCAAALGPQWHPAMCNNPPGSMYPDLFGSWYAMQPQRLLAGGAAAGPSTGSVSSINKQSEVSMQGMPLQWAKTNGGTHSRTRAEVLKSNTDCGQDSLPSVHAGNAMKTSGEALVQKRQDKRTASGTYGFRLGMSKPVVNNELRWLGELKNGAELTVDAEDDDEQVNDGECSPNRSLDALNLFPLVPTMSPNVHGGGSRDKQAGVGEWKGQVIRVTPRPAVAASESAAEILLSLQQERQQ